MKKSLILLVLLCITLATTAQNSTVTLPKISVTDKSVKLKTATGWKQDATANWLSNTNAISDTQLSESTQSTVWQNFKWMQLLAVSVANENYYVLLYENSIFVSNTRNERRVNYYVMTAKSYADLLKSIERKDGSAFTVHSSTYGYMSDEDGVYSQEKLFRLMSQSIMTDTGVQYDFVVSSQTTDDREVIRFRLPERATIMGGQLKDGYFETTYFNFAAILLPAPVIVSNEFELEVTGATTTSNSSSNTNKAPETQIATRQAIQNPEPLDADFSLDDNTASESKSTIEKTAQAPLTPETDNEIGDRINREKGTVSPPIATLDNVRGWYYNTEGKWVNENDYSYRFETVGKYEMRRMSYRQQEYIVFIKYEKYAGAKYYLISKDSYVEAIRSVNTGAAISFPVIMQAGVGNTMEDVIKKAEEAIDAPQGEKIIINTNYLVLQHRTSQARDLARFFIFEQACTQYGESGSVNCDVKVSGKIKYDDVPIIGTEALFDKMYYETSYKKFDTFLQAPLLAAPAPASEKAEKENTDKYGDGLNDRN